MKFVLLRVINLIFLSLDIFAVKDSKYESLTFTINSLKEQIELFSSSKLIISPHGAGLSFATFSHQYHTVICEINPNH